MLTDGEVRVLRLPGVPGRGGSLHPLSPLSQVIVLQRVGARLAQMNGRDPDVPPGHPRSSSLRELRVFVAQSWLGRRRTGQAVVQTTGRSTPGKHANTSALSRRSQSCTGLKKEVAALRRSGFSRLFFSSGCGFGQTTQA